MMWVPSRVAVLAGVALVLVGADAAALVGVAVEEPAVVVVLAGRDALGERLVASGGILSQRSNRKIPFNSQSP